MTDDDGAQADTVASTMQSIAPASPSVGAAELHEVSRTRYQVAAEIGRGGIGRILRARDLHLERTVALKELHAEDDAARRRFVREALITARLQHPAIVPVYEAGRWPDQAPFYAMKLVVGKPLDKVLAAAATFDDRIAHVPTVLAVADAVAYAHAERVIHRDLKPSNILVGRYGETVVIDWGLAKDLSIDDTDALPAGPYRRAASDQTIDGAILGTPMYMAPEQALGEEVDERADVYAIGAILYHLVSGRGPHADSSIDRILARAATGDVEPLAAIEPRTPVDLLAIIGKAMAHAPAERYANAGELADDLRRFTTGKLVAAHRYTVVQRLGRWLRRHRAVATAVAVAVVALAALAVWSFRSIGLQRDQARAAAELATASAADAILAHARQELDNDPAESLAWLARLDPEAGNWAAARVIAADALSRPRLERTLALGIARPDYRISGDVVLAWRYDWLVIADPELRAFALTETQLLDTVDWYLCADRKRAVAHVRGAFGNQLGRAVELDLTTKVDRSYTGIEVVLAKLAGCTDEIRFLDDHGIVAWWDAAAGRARILVPNGGELWDGFDRKHAITRDASGTITWWEPETHTARRLGTIPGDSYFAEISADARVAAFSLPAATIVLTAEGEVRLPATSAFVVAHDGSWVAYYAKDALNVWRPGQPEIKIGLVRGRVDRLEVSDNPRVVFAFGERATLIDIAARSAIELPRAVGLQLDTGNRLSEVDDGILRVWKFSVPPITTFDSTSVVVSPDGRYVVASSMSELVRYDRGARVPPERVSLDNVGTAGLRSAVLSTNGSLLFEHANGVWTWPVGKPPRALVAEAQVEVLSWSANGLARNTDASWIVEWAPDGTEHTVWKSPQPDKLMTAGASDDRRTIVLARAPLLATSIIRDGVERPIDGAGMAGLSPDGTTVIVGRADRTGVLIYDVTSATSRTVNLRGIEIDKIVFSPDQKRAAIVTYDRLYCVELATGELRGIDVEVVRGVVVFDPNRPRLVAAVIARGRQYTLLWDLESGEHRMLLGEQAIGVRWDGDRIELLTDSASIIVDDDLPHAPQLLRARLAGLHYRLDLRALGRARVQLE